MEAAMEKAFEIQLLTEMLGTVPKDPAIYKSFIETKKPQDKEEDESLTVEKIEEKGWTGFHKDEHGLFIYDYMVKGFLKHAGNVLKENLKIKALRSKLDDFIFIFPRKIYLGKEEPDGVLERPIRIMTAQGPRVALIRSDYVNIGTVLKFRFVLFPHKEITWEVIQQLLGYGEFMGLGQFRNGGYGKFMYHLV